MCARSVGQQLVEPGPAVGTDPQRPSVDQQARFGEPVNGAGNVVGIFSERRGQVGKAHSTLQPDRLQHGQLAHVRSLRRIAASMASSGLADTTSVWPLASAARTAPSEWLFSRG